MVESNENRFEMRKWNAVAMWSWGKYFSFHISNILNLSITKQTKKTFINL